MDSIKEEMLWTVCVIFLALVFFYPPPVRVIMDFSCVQMCTPPPRVSIKGF